MEKDNWKHLRPAAWRTTLGGIVEDSEEEELDRKVREEGPDAFSHLKDIIENDKANDELRCRAMGWLVSLYGEPYLNGEAIVEVLNNVVRSTLGDAYSQRRRDALMALVRLRQSPWADAPPDLSYLLELATDTSLSRDVTNDVLSALAETGSPEAIEALAHGILVVKQSGLVPKLVTGIQEIRDVEWTRKAAVFLELIEQHAISSSDVNADAVVRALNPSWEEDPIRRLTEIGDFVIERSRNSDGQLARVLAKLLIASEGGDQIQAGHRINEYRNDHNIPDNELEGLREAVGGAPALSGIRGILHNDLEKYFQMPIHELNESTRQSWEKAITSARYGLVMRLWMSGIVFAVGILLLLASSVRMLLESNGSPFEPTTIIPFVSGLGTMLLIIFTGPLQEIRQAVTDLATASTAFIAYVHRVLETSHTFSFHYMHEKITFEDTEKASAILKEAMINTIEALDRAAKSSSERTITRVLKRLNVPMGKAE